MEGELPQRFETVHRRFDAIDDRFDSLDRRFDAIEDRFDSLDRRLDKLESTLLFFGVSIFVLNLATLISVLATRG
jgi:hypothetical protein